MAKKKSLQDFTLRTIPIAQIKRAKYNPRRGFTEAELKSFEADMEHFSCVLPLVWNERTGNLVGGHKRLDWLEKKGAKTVQVAVVDFYEKVIRGLSKEEIEKLSEKALMVLIEKEEKLLNLALNRQGEGLWDWEKFNVIVEELKIGDMAVEVLELTGFTPLELGALDGFGTPEVGDALGFEKGQSTKNENWFYIEYYQQKERFAKLKAMLAQAGFFKSKASEHELDADLFYKLVMEYAKKIIK